MRANSRNQRIAARCVTFICLFGDLLISCSFAAVCWSLGRWGVYSASALGVGALLLLLPAHIWSSRWILRYGNKHDESTGRARVAAVAVISAMLAAVFLWMCAVGALCRTFGMPWPERSICGIFTSITVYHGIACLVAVAVVTAIAALKQAIRQRRRREVEADSEDGITVVA